MVKILCVHGLAATRESWFDIPEALASAGHSVKAVSLPGGIFSGLDDFVTSIVANLPTSEQCVLVGHSMGGVSISQVAASYPKQVLKLIYVTALVPRDGESAGSIIGGLSTSFDAVGNEFDRLGIDSTHPARRFPALGALRGRFQSSPEFATIPKHFVRCSNDTIVKPAEQTQMIEKWPGTSESSVASGHIPQKEAPDELTRVLLEQMH